MTPDERAQLIEEGAHLERERWARNRRERWLNAGRVTFEADKGQVEAFDELLATLREQCKGSKTQAIDRMLSAMGEEIARGLQE